MSRRGYVHAEDLPYGPGNPDYENDGEREPVVKLSPEELSLIDAGNEGRRAGMFGHGASLNPYQFGSPEYFEWDRQRLATIAARISGRLAA